MAIGLGTEDPIAFRIRATALENAKKIDEAIVDLKVVVASDPNDWESYLRLAALNRDLGQISYAIAYISHVIKAGYKLRSSHECRGRVFEQIQKYPAAYSDYRQALDMCGGGKQDEDVRARLVRSLKRVEKLRFLEIYEWARQ